jgi:hypothetical protein
MSPMHIRLMCALSALLVATAAATQALPPCAPDQDTASMEMPAFAEDNDFDIQIRRGPSGLELRVTGDTVVIDTGTLGSMLASPSAPKTGVTRFTVDARIIRLAGSLAFQDASVVLLAERLEIVRNGRISLFSSAPTAQRALEIYADKVVFKDAPKRPFDLALVSGGEARSRIAVVDFDGSKTGDEVWRRFTDSVESAIPAAFELSIGDAAKESFADALSARMEWPLYFAAKVRKHFARAPFNEVNRQSIGALAETYLPLTATLENSAPYSTLSAVLAAIRNDADLDGHGVAFTPKQDLSSQSSDIEAELVSDPFGRLSVLLAGTSNDRVSIDAQLRLTRNALSDVAARERAITAEMDEFSRELALAIQRSQKIDDLIRDRVAQLKEEMEARAERLREAQKAKQFATVTASAIAIAGTMGAATPAVAAGAAAGVAVVGEYVYQRNVGQGVSLSGLLEIGATTYAATAKFQESWATLRANQKLAWSVYDGARVFEGEPPADGKPDTRKPLSKTAVTKRLLSTASDAVRNAEAIAGKQIAAPQPLSLDEMQNGDEAMRALIAERVAVMNRIGTLAAQIDAGMRELEGVMAARVDLATTDEQLRTAKPTNDQENARWNAISTALWGQYVQRIADKLQTYRKSLYFETGVVLTGSASVFEYPNALRSKLVLGVFDPLAGADPTDPKAIEAALKQESAKFLSAARAVKTAVDDAFRGYLASRAQAGVVRRSRVFKADSTNSVDRQFMEVLNAQLRQQIVTKVPGRDILPAYVPFILPSSIVPHPERLVQATVVRAEFDVGGERIGSNALEFHIIHPQYGQMRRGDTCRLADFRSKPTDWRYFTTPYEMVTGDWLKQSPTRVEITTRDTGRFYAYLPARAPYFLVVNNLSGNWSKLPRLLVLELGFEVMQ